MSHSDKDDSQLIERARQGEVDAYGEFVRRYQDQALGTAFVLLRDRQEAEDATQEAFAKAYIALGRFRPDGSFRTWLLSIVVNEARDVLSARQRRSELLSRAAGSVENVGSVESAESAALGQRRRELLLSALFDLPETDRLVLTCRYFLDLSEAETAQVLGIARGTVKSRLSRALARLGPIVRELGPLVVVPPVVDLPHAVVQQVGAAGAATGAKGALASASARLRSNVGHLAALAGAAVAGLLLASFLMVTSGRSELSTPAPSPTAAPARSITVFGGDLTDAERQQVAATLPTGAAATDTVSRQEMVETLAAQGLSVQSSDAAISSLQLRCGGAISGVEVRLRNIGRRSAAEYAAAVITAGLYDASVMAAAPETRSVSGEAALIGLFKAFPTCSSGSGPDAHRVQLAYQQLKLVAEMAGSSPDTTRASAAFLDVLNAMLAGKAPDTSSLQQAIASAASHQGLALDERTSDDLTTYFEQLSHVDYGPYSHGLIVQDLGQDSVKVTPAQ